jgi:HAD superfamily hydrolase (TIGR01549 family)
MADTAIVDVDGTLVDTNYHHALAWSRAFRRYDVAIPLWRLHRGVGMGGDVFVPEVAGEAVEDEHGDDLRDAWSEEFDRLIDEVRPLDGAHELLRELKDRGFRLVLASSGAARHVEQFLDLVEGRDLADAWTTSEDAGTSKPAPDLVQNALRKVDGTSAAMIGDSVYDVMAAGHLDIPTLALRTGGFSAAELREVGAVEVFDSPRDLRDHLDDTVLARPGA